MLTVIIFRAVRAALIESLLFHSLGFMARMNDSVAESFNDALCLTEHAASSPCQWTHTELASSCNVNKWLAGSQAWILHVHHRRSADSDWKQRWLGGAQSSTERTGFLHELPVSTVMLFTGARSGEEMHELYIWHRQPPWLRLMANRAEIMRTGGGLALWELWTESLSHCRPPELQLTEVRFHPRSAQSKTNNLLLLAQIYSGTLPPQKQYLLIFLLSALIDVLGLKLWLLLIFFHSCLVLPFSFPFGSFALFLAPSLLNFTSVQATFAKNS